MGVCGCGSFWPEKIYKIAEDRYLVIDRYQGCDGCNADPDIRLHLLNERQIEQYTDAKIEPWVPEKEEYGDSYKHIGLIGIHGLLKASKEEMADYVIIDGCGEEYDLINLIKQGDYYESLEMFLEDHGRDLLKHAILEGMKNDNS